MLFFHLRIAFVKWSSWKWLENMYRAMMIFWLTCLVGYPRTSAPEPIKMNKSFISTWFFIKIATMTK